ncbi:hypothetical protein [Arthrobacter sp. NA-172]|uniref:hypothetical protein n=1 Tax=Arthrobacter sp. NA-172 TaxID=3367524 RepID=UPI0037544FDA
MTHQHDGGAHLHSETDRDADPSQFWDEVYREKPKRWSGNPNPQLIAEAKGLAPGTARAPGLRGGRGRDLARPAWLDGDRGGRLRRRS